MSSLKKKNRNKKQQQQQHARLLIILARWMTRVMFENVGNSRWHQLKRISWCPGLWRHRCRRERRGTFAVLCIYFFLYIHFTQSYGIGKNKDEGSIWHWYNLIKYSDQGNIFHFALSLFPFSFFVGLLLWSWLITITSLGNVRMMKCKRWAHELGVACLMKVVMPFIGLH